MSINRVVISGNLTRDPDLRQTGSGTPVMNLGVAVNERRRNNQTGEWTDFPNFIDCVMFGSRAENVSRYLSKGTKVQIDGKLRWSQWERDGRKYSKVEVVVENIEFYNSRKNNEQAAPKNNEQTAPLSAYTNQYAPQSAQPGLVVDSVPSQGSFYDDPYYNDEDIPF